MRRIVYGMLLLFPALALGADRYRLESELRTAYSGGNASATYTAYGYDEDGNRIDMRVFDGADDGTTLMSTVRYERDSRGRCTEEVLLDAGGDTLSIVRYTYGNAGLVRAATLRKDGTVRFVDSVFYEAELAVRQCRYSGAGTMTFYHAYGYEAGLLSTDSLYETDGAGGYLPTQARLIERNSDATVASEANWRLSGGAWYCVSTTVMSYEQTNLVAATTYETDGTSRRLIDSLAYAYDEDGNRTQEEAFDDERVLTYDIVYTWRDTEAVFAAARPGGTGTQARPVYRNGRICFGTRHSGAAMVFAVDGGVVARRHLTHASTLEPSRPLTPGTYLVRLSGTVNQSFPLTIYH